MDPLSSSPSSPRFRESFNENIEGSASSELNASSVVTAPCNHTLNENECNKVSCFIQSKLIDLLFPFASICQPSSSSTDLDFQPQLHEIAFGKAKWAKYFGDIGIEPPLPPNIDEILNSPCIFKPEKRVYETHLLVLIPNTVDGKPFHLDLLGNLIRKSKEGFKTRYKWYDDNIRKKLGEKSEPSHWVLITRDVIPGSRNKEYDIQQAFIQSHTQNSGIPYELPTALEAATAILVEYVQTGKRLYSATSFCGDNPVTYTRCKDQLITCEWPVAVGNFNEYGLSIVLSYARERHSDGVGGSRNLDTWCLDTIV